MNRHLTTLCLCVLVVQGYAASPRALSSVTPGTKTMAVFLTPPPEFVFTYTNQTITWGVWTGQVGNVIYSTTNLSQKDWVMRYYSETNWDAGFQYVSFPRTNGAEYFINQTWPTGADAWKQ